VAYQRSSRESTTMEASLMPAAEARSAAPSVPAAEAEAVANGAAAEAARAQAVEINVKQMLIKATKREEKLNRDISAAMSERDQARRSAKSLGAQLGALQEEKRGLEAAMRELSQKCTASVAALETERKTRRDENFELEAALREQTAARDLERAERDQARAERDQARSLETALKAELCKTVREAAQRQREAEDENASKSELLATTQRAEQLAQVMLSGLALELQEQEVTFQNKVQALEAQLLHLQNENLQIAALTDLNQRLQLQLQEARQTHEQQASVMAPRFHALEQRAAQTGRQAAQNIADQQFAAEKLHVILKHAQAENARLRRYERVCSSLVGG